MATANHTSPAAVDPGIDPPVDVPRLTCMHCGKDQAFWDPCDCLIAVGKEIRAKAGQAVKRGQRKKKQKDVTPDKPQQEMF